MTHCLSDHQAVLLQGCLELALNLKTHAEAERRFLELQTELQTEPATVEVLQRLWKEVLAARRSAAFWEQMSNVEKSMSDGLATDHLRLQQNYLRLIQEQ
jgi:hypothetical protein